MRSGRLRHTIEIVSIGEIRDDMGGFTEGETLLAEMRAEIKAISGNEKFMANQRYSEATSQIRCRYVSGVSTKCKIRFGSRTFDIVDAQNRDEKNVELIIIAKEIA